MEFIYFKRPDGAIVSREKSVGLANKEAYLKTSKWVECDKDGNTETSKKSKEKKSD